MSGVISELALVAVPVLTEKSGLTAEGRMSNSVDAPHGLVPDMKPGLMVDFWSAYAVTRTVACSELRGVESSTSKKSPELLPRYSQPSTDDFAAV